MSKSKQNPKKTDKKAADSFVWTDDEVELLLKVTMEYKTSRAIENIDWESCQTKYGDILQLFVDQYPTPKNAVAIEKDFPRIVGDGVAFPVVSTAFGVRFVHQTTREA